MYEHVKSSWRKEINCAIVKIRAGEEAKNIIRKERDERLMKIMKRDKQTKISEEKYRNIKLMVYLIFSYLYYKTIQNSIQLKL